jgi:hypothetical protein
MTVMNAVLDADRSACEKERWVRVSTVIAVGLLCPALLWFAAYGRTPLVRGGYSLMAMGTAMLLFAEWLHRTWSRQALPGAADARSELQKLALVVARQASLYRTAPIWCAPVFLGAVLVGTWVYQERSVGGGYLLWASIGTGWLVSWMTGFSKAKKLTERRTQIESLLSEFDSCQDGSGP